MYSKLCLEIKYKLFDKSTVYCLLFRWENTNTKIIFLDLAFYLETNLGGLILKVSIKKLVRRTNKSSVINRKLGGSIPKLQVPTYLKGQSHEKVCEIMT
jgi:hypothetical protein